MSGPQASFCGHDEAPSDFAEMGDQRGSDTALFANVAYKLAGLTANEIDDFRAKLGLDVGRAAVEHATSKHPVMRVTGTAAAVRKWTLVDERRLGVFPAMLELAPRAVEPAADDARRLYAAAQAVCGVRQLLLPESRHVVWAVVLYDGPSDADRIRGELEALGNIQRWDVIRAETWEPAAATWSHLARERARREGFLASGGA